MLTSVVHVGEPAALGVGVQPSVIVHLHEGGLPRMLAYELEDDGTLDRVPGTYTPDPTEEPPHPITDVLLGLCPEGSVAGQRLRTLSQKAAANASVSFREKIFGGDIGPETPGYGRHFEARSQLEAHRYQQAIVVGYLPGISDSMRSAIEANLTRLDAPIWRMTG
ncbi:MAG: hypothetical protein PPP58_04275 [Natronomonas sp.]